MYLEKQSIFINDICVEISKLQDEHQSRAAWNAINKITGRKVKKSGLINADSDDDRNKKWFEHFKNLLSATTHDNSTEQHVFNCVEEFKSTSESYNISEIKITEVLAAAESLKNNKACGADNICNEYLKLPELHPLITKILNECWLTKLVPSEFHISLIVPIHKKGSTSVCNNYRGIALMSTSAKLYNRILLDRLRPIIDPLLRYNQNGFRQLRSTGQHVLAARRLIEEVNMSSDQKLVAVFIDFTKAFDSISWSWIRGVLQAYCVPTQLIEAIMSVYIGAKAAVRSNTGTVSEAFDLSVGVLQGDCLAPYIFIIVLDYVLRHAIDDISCGFQYCQRKSSRYEAKFITDLDFADDIGLFANTVENVQIMLSSIETWALKVGLAINTDKTKYMLVGRGWNDAISITTSSGEIERVEDFKYLGSYLRNSSNDFIKRKELAWVSCIKLTRIWKSETISRKTKLNLFKACVESILFFNASSWTMTKGLETKLDGAHSKLLRYALNIHFTEHKTNVEVYQDYPKATTILKQRRLAFVGHCLRSIESAPQPVSDLILWRIFGKKRQGNFKSYLKILLNDIGFEYHKEESAFAKEMETVRKLIFDRHEWNILLKKLK
jgi:hypothetical protein